MAAGREIQLRIRGIQYPTRDVTAQEVTASYFFRAGAHYLLYEEQPEGFEQPFKTRVKLRGKHLEIDRQGPMGSNMVFEPGKIWRTEYVTPFGRLPLDIVTEALEVMPDESFAGSAGAEMPDCDAGTWQDVKVRYFLMNQDETLGEYELYIERIQREIQHEKNGQEHNGSCHGDCYCDHNDRCDHKDRG